MHTCRHRQHSGAGFTLLELLIVLALIAIASVFSVAAIDKLAGRLEQRRWSDLTQQSLTKLRNKAVMGGAVVMAVVDFDGGELLHVGSDSQRQLLVLPKAFQFVAPASAGTADEPVRTMPLYFYPDGTMDEAVFDLVLPSEGRRRFHLARFTGKIERTVVDALPQ